MERVQHHEAEARLSQKIATLVGSIAIFTEPASILGHARRLIRRLRQILNIVHELIIRCEEGNKRKKIII